MRHKLLRTTFLAIVLSLVAVTTAVSTPGVASDAVRTARITSDKIAAVDKAADAFLALAKDAATTGRPPRQGDPAVKALLDVVFDTAGLNDGDPLPYSELSKLNRWMLRVNAVGTVYILAGTGLTDDPFHPPRPNDQQEHQIGKNIVTYAPELGRMYDAVLQLQRALMDSYIADRAANPDRSGTQRGAQELEQMGGFMKKTVSSTLKKLYLLIDNPDWVKARLVVLNTEVPSLKSILSVGDCQELADESRWLAGKMADPAAKAALIAFADQLGK
jgi:hypothetical protein